MIQNNLKIKNLIFAVLLMVILETTVLAGDLPGLPTTRGFISAFIPFCKKLLPLLLKLLPAIIIALALKTFLLKKKLGTPFKSIDKLIISNIGESAVEIVFFFLLVYFFSPAVSSILGSLKLTFASTSNPPHYRFLSAMIFILPYQFIIGTILNNVLINLLNPISKSERKKYIPTAVLLSVIVPLLVIVYYFLGPILFKWK